MAQKNFFAIVTLIACSLAYVWAEWTLLECLSGKSSDLTLAAANAFGILAACLLLTALFIKKSSRVLIHSAVAWCVLSCIVASFNGWAATASLIGGGFLTASMSALFVFALIRYEDLGQPRR